MSVFQNVYFRVGDNEFKTFDDFGLVLQSKVIPPATPKITRVDVPARNSSLDYSEVLGPVRYDDRTIVMNFKITDMKFETIEQFKSRISALIDGKKGRIIFDDDIGYYWLGRFTISPFNIGRGINPVITFSITAVCDAYKYSIFTNDDDWLWDPFDFDDGIINQVSNYIIPSHGHADMFFIVPEDDRIVSPTFIVEKDGSTTFQLFILNELRQPVLITTLNVNKANSYPLYDVVLQQGREYMISIDEAGPHGNVISFNYVGGRL